MIRDGGTELRRYLDPGERLIWSDPSRAARTPAALSWLLVLFAVGVQGGSAQDVWTVAEQSIRHLPADSFAGLPDPVRLEMRRLECLVPQGSDLTQPHNVLVGRFAAQDQVDWAFLCSSRGSSSIHVLWGGAQRCPTPIQRAEDRSYLQGLGGDSIGFSRRLIPADRDRMMGYAAAFDGPRVPPVWYQGIEDYFEGKASTVLLCVDGKWITLAGID